MKQIKRIVILQILILSLMNCSGQIKTTNDNSSLTTKPVLLLRYLIDPINKTVSRQEYWEKDEPNGIHSWGYSFPIDTAINFETTCLYVMDNYIEFKEHHKPKLPRFVDIWNKPLDISLFNYTYDHIYEKGGIYYFPDDDANFQFGYIQLRKVFVENGISLQGLNYVGKRFFYDNNGLYHLNNDETGEFRLITISKAKNRHPVLKKTYCEYNGEAFTLDYDNPMKINTDLVKLYEIDVNRNDSWPFLTDGTTVFKYSMSERLKEIKVPGLSSWKQLSTGQFLKEENNCITLSPLFESPTTYIYDKLFFSPDEGFFTVDFFSFEKKAHFDKVIIYNYDKGAYEDIDINQFELLIIDFFTYKGKLYYKGIPVENDLNSEKLQYLQRIWGSADWLSDGSQLFHIYGREETGKDLGKKISFATVLVDDIRQLKVVTGELLVDNVNFYQFNGREIEVIPIKSLGVDVIKDLSIYAWQENK